MTMPEATVNEDNLLLRHGVRSYTERAAFSGEDVIGAPAMTVEFKAHPTVVEEVPAALSELLVDQNARMPQVLAWPGSVSIARAETARGDSSAAEAAIEDGDFMSDLKVRPPSSHTDALLRKHGVEFDPQFVFG
jgi:hypothetical protein